MFLELGSDYFIDFATVADRIVSRHKPHARPLVRCKKVNRAEFGVRVNMLLVDGISFIEHFSHDNFNEGIRLQSAIHLQERYFGACRQMGADAIDGTIAGRTYCAANNIAASFASKGNGGKLKEKKGQMRSILAKKRSTVWEGRFGNERNLYPMDKIKKRNQGNEQAWIFFACFLATLCRLANGYKLQEKQVCNN